MPSYEGEFGCRSGVMAISDYQVGKAVAAIPIGTDVDGARYDPASGDAFASNANGTLTVIHQDTPDTYYVVENVPTPQGSRNMGSTPQITGYSSSQPTSGRHR